MRYWWDYLFTASDRAHIMRSVDEFNTTIGTMIDWAEEEEKKFMTERQNDNQESSR